MKIGKVPQEVLDNVVLGSLKSIRPEVLIKPSVGEDCTAIKLNKDEVVVMSTDPITGTSNNLGKLSVNINVNDLASSGAEPIGLLVTILLPPKASETELKKIMDDFVTECSKLGMDILGGHTEVTDAVNRPVISVTAIGKVKEDNLVKSCTASPLDDVIMTKWAGLEGTAIISHDKEEELSKVMDEKLINSAKGLAKYLSVLNESKIASQLNVNSMHDITEGGILGAAWEVAYCSNVGIEIYIDNIPIREETRVICDYYKIDPLKLISSGCMLITTKHGQKLIDELKKSGIEANIIGRIRSDKMRITVSGTKINELTEPDVDELYKIT